MMTDPVRVTGRGVLSAVYRMRLPCDSDEELREGSCTRHVIAGPVSNNQGLPFNSDADGTERAVTCLEMTLAMSLIFC